MCRYTDMPYANQKAALVAMNIVPCTTIWHSLTKFIKYKTELDRKSTKTDLGVTQCTGKYVHRLYKLQFTHLVDRKSSSVRTNASVYTLLIEHMVQFLRTVVNYFFVQCHEIFCFRFFSWIILPQAPGNKKGSFWIFRKFAEIFAN